MAYDLVKHAHPHAPCVVGARVAERGGGRLGTLAPQVPGLPAGRVRVRFDGQFRPEACDPTGLDYAVPPPTPTDPWCAR